MLSWSDLTPTSARLMNTVAARYAHQLLPLIQPFLVKVTSLHKDHYENIYVVIRGTKHFTLYPPTEVRLS